MLPFSRSVEWWICLESSYEWAGRNSCLEHTNRSSCKSFSLNREMRFLPFRDGCCRKQNDVKIPVNSSRSIPPTATNSDFDFVYLLNDNDRCCFYCLGMHSSMFSNDCCRLREYISLSLERWLVGRDWDSNVRKHRGSFRRNGFAPLLGGILPHRPRHH